MRIPFSNLERPKSAAKRLSRLSPDVTLAKAQNVLSRGMGYRDWHELSGAALGAAMPLPEVDPAVMADIVLFLADTLGFAAGDVQYALSKSRLLGRAPLSTDDQIAIHMRALRQGFLGTSARGRTGTIVKIRAHGATRLAYLVEWGRPTKVLYDTGEGHCADFEAVTPRTPPADFLPARLWLPYGIWTYPDGSEVVFARDYLPLWRIAGNVVERLDPWLWMQGWVKEQWFANETESGWYRGQGKENALAYLQAHRIFELPRLANAMQYMFDRDVEGITDAVRRMSGCVQHQSRLPPGAIVRRELTAERPSDVLVLT